MYDTIQKTIAAWAFNHYIAYYYFDNVNVSQLKVAFEKGEVELENLPIKRDALSHFNLPMEVVSGIVGKLSIKVPLLSLLSDPWVIKITKLMLIVEPKKQTNNTNANTQQSSTSAAATAAAAAEESFVSTFSDQSQLDLMQETGEPNSTDTQEGSTSLGSVPQECTVNSEETKLAEFYSSFSASVSAMVHDIYKNIRLEIESMTILFEEFDHGLVKFDVDSLLLHRPKSVRNLVVDNVSFYLSDAGPSGTKKGSDLLRVRLGKGNLDIYDEASTNMQLALPQQNTGSGSSSSQPSTRTSETKIEGTFKDVSIDLLASSSKKFGIKSTSSASPTASNGHKEGDSSLSKRNILDCDTIRLEFKLNNNSDDETMKLSEKNLHLKLDLVGMQYIHSQRIYEITTQRLMSLLRFFVRIQARKQSDQSQLALMRKFDGDWKDPIEKGEKTSFNKLLIVNIEEGLMYIVDESLGTCAIPLLEFSLEDCRILQFSGNNQQNGFVFAKIGCSYYNREVSTWNPLLEPWPFNLTWDLKSVGTTASRRIQHRQISLNSDEMANFVLSSALLDLGDIALKRMVNDIINPRLWPISRSLSTKANPITQEFNEIFVIHNETGHRLLFAPLEHASDTNDPNDSLTGLSSMSVSGDDVTSRLMHKLSINSRSSAGSRDSPDPNCLARWIPVEAGELVSFEYATLPIYRRYINDPNAQSRVLLVRVEGWKILNPISLDRTGVFYREACSDRVMNEDTYIVVSINLEEGSARKVISIRSPYNLVNLLDATLEVHFEESNQALYIKPDSHLAVPLPYLFNRMRIRPCNVGVTMSKGALSWDDTKEIFDYESRLHICHPITVTNQRHASYCTSQAYRVCVSTQRDGYKVGDHSLESILHAQVPVFTTSFIPPLTLVNLLPCKLQYFIGDLDGTLNMGSQQKIYHVDTTRPTEVHFSMNGFPQSKSINIDPGATGSFNHTLELLDKKNRSLYLNAKIILVSHGDEPAVQVTISAPFWFLNKTRLPLIFKQEGAVLEAAGQFREHEESASSTLLFSFYDTELEPPFLCSMRLGKSKGLSMWCDGFKLEKGSGERRLCFLPESRDKDTKMNKSLIDINIRRGFGRYSETMIVTLTARYGFDPLTKTPKKATVPSPQNYKLTSYNHNVNLADKIACQAVSLFNNNHQRKGTSDMNLIVPGFKLTLVDNSHEKLLEGVVKKIRVKCTTRAKEQILDCSIQDIRIDNMLPDCEKGVMLDRAAPNLDESVNIKPALRLIMDRIVGNSFGTTLFRQVQLSMCELVLNIEEKLMLKLVEFISFRSRRQQTNMNNLSHDLDKILHPEDDRMSKYWFDLLRIDLSSLNLSVFTSSNLPSSLQRIKSYLGLKFFGFEDAQVQLAPYFKMNVSRTFKDVFESVTRFYKRQILEQAPRIVGQQIQNYLRFHLSDLLSTLYDEVYNKLFN